LQKISHNENDVKNLSLDYLRNNCKIIDDLSENLKKRLLPYSNAQVIVVIQKDHGQITYKIITVYPD
jgi:hypothetical protein